MVGGAAQTKIWSQLAFRNSRREDSLFLIRLGETLMLGRNVLYIFIFFKPSAVPGT